MISPLGKMLFYGFYVAVSVAYLVCLYHLKDWWLFFTFLTFAWLQNMENWRVRFFNT